jgi:hypothetical protein
MLCHHLLQQYLNKYREATEVDFDPRAPLYRSFQLRFGFLTKRPLS